jgi:hypothetical protein
MMIVGCLMSPSVNWPCQLIGQLCHCQCIQYMLERFDIYFSMGSYGLNEIIVHWLGDRPKF